MIGPAALVPLVGDLLDHLVAGDLDQAAAVLDHVVEDGDDADAYGLCIAAANATRVALQGDPPGRAPLARLLGPSSPPADPHRLFAARFLAAYGRGDREMTVALFRAAAEAGDPRVLTESVCALLARVSGLLRAGSTTPCHERT
ncbi:hypothetical protein [Streptomyces chryseus]|uniref:Uncharacterized protein n=1 Tax=Streptomyces chryseus TaxID=68186 RepID=A0ABQ3DJR7_9ACTN|nr:hypothetical protein [Streptomyces chryseus]GHA94092.1 hypothetical protein GCM10010346_16020 [Streptomyces chryseus]